MVRKSKAPDEMRDAEREVRHVGTAGVPKSGKVLNSAFSPRDQAKGSVSTPPHVCGICRLVPARAQATWGSPAVRLWISHQSPTPKPWGSR